MKETIYIGLRSKDGTVRILKDGVTALRPKGSTALFSDPHVLDWGKGNHLGHRLLAMSILYDFLEDEKKAEELATSFVKRFIEDLDDRGYRAGWTLVASQIYDFLEVEVSSESQSTARDSTA